ncbi:heterotrimeric G protein alpha subunit 4 [Mycena leptocephala]|nr:heterotrimeric G protein alpha subunit 4 [Mycena leptocephala]
MLTGIHAWFSDSKASSASSADESWYASLCTTLKLLRHPKSENLLPKSAAIATAAKFRDLVPTVLESQLVETLQEAKEQFSDQVHANTSSQSHARESNFKKLKKAQGKTPFKSPTQKTAKYLLLGSADSGKSTLLKQMRIIYDVPFSHQEIEFWRQLAFENVLHGMGYLLDSLPDLGLSLPATLSSAEQTINNGKHQYMYDDDTFPEQYLGAIAALWNDLTVQTAIRRGGESALPENLSYLCAILPRIFSPSFVPTHHDIFHLRARSTGITETVMSNGIQVVDVGGAKSERRKWIHTFNDVTVIIFTVGLSGYDRCLIEDQDDNQMQDSMAIWDSICHSKWFEGTPIILCLNKNDLFEREVLHSDIVNFFPDFQGDRGDAVAGRNYFINRFSRLANRAGRVLDKDVFIHVVTATDTGMMAELMNSVARFYEQR